MRRSIFLSLVLLLALPGSASATEEGRSGEQGRLTEYRLAPGTRAQALVAGPDGNVWFAGLRYGPNGVSDVIGRVTPGGGVTEFPFGEHAENLGLSDIAVGPDGNLWFTVGGRPRIGRITPAGTITEFELPTPGARASSIAAGSDGNLWFTEEAPRNVGRITPSGAVTEFTLTTDLAGPHGIVAGPDGALWVVQPAASTVTRIGTDGAQIDFPLPGDELYPREIVAGPDGSLWVSQTGEAVLARVATGGEVTELPVPGGDQTYALASGPSGVLWYSNGGGRIGSVTPDGATARPACIRTCRLPITSLAQGPEGRLWFAAGVEPRQPSSTAGTVGTFAPPPLQGVIASRPELRGAGMRIRVRCDWGVAGRLCEGRLRLYGRLDGVGSRERKSRLLASRRLRLGQGAERDFRLRLPGSVVRGLAEGGRLVARVKTRVSGGATDALRLTLRRP